MKMENVLVIVNAVFLTLAIVLWAVARNIFGVGGLNVNLTALGNGLRWVTLVLFGIGVAGVGYLSLAGGPERGARIGKVIIGLVLLVLGFAFVTRL